MPLPGAFLNNMKALLGQEYEAFLHAMDEPAPVSIRVNPFKYSLHIESGRKVPWCSSGYYLPSRPSFTLDPLFHAGTYYVQEASSMFLESIFKFLFTGMRPLRLLDACAAPGGKSTHLISMMPPGSLLVSNEIISSRNSVLRQNLARWGSPDVIVTQNDPQSFALLEDHFDLVLADAPCSGEGLFRRDPSAAEEWSPQQVEKCSLRQSAILKHLSKCVKPGGYLVYSTCTFETGENELQVEKLLDSGEFESVVQLPVFPGIAVSETGCRFYPHRISGEGLFFAVLKRKETEVFGCKAVKNDFRRFQDPLTEGYLSDSRELVQIKKGERIHALSESVLKDLPLLAKHLLVRQAGVYMGDLKGRTFIPSAELALSTSISQEIPCAELGEKEAIQYLRGEPVYPQNAGKGWCLARFRGFNLGWMKILNARSNNYFPKGWRILNNP
ncbi:MAG: RNA methyltransferase [Bacteroidia bacterium]|nr:RNA methyltransferase [Bacteroidia bacterium]